ncbi:hypothetical protein QTP88_015991 [Uroleucon formosanum]
MTHKNPVELAVAAARRCDGRVATAVTSWYCGGASGEMCAVSREPENVSRTSVAFGVASLAILLTGFVTGSWVTTREPYRVPGTDGAYTAAAFRIGLWKICPTLRKTNSTTSEKKCYVFFRKSLINQFSGGGNLDDGKSDLRYLSSS